MAYVSRHFLGATAADPLAPVRAGTLALKRGSKGEAVRAVQRLIRQGQEADGAATESLIAIDGDFGPKTEEAVRKIQRALSLTVDGIVGKQTIAALESTLASAATAVATAIDPTKRTPAKPLTKAEIIKKAKEDAKAAALSKINVVRQKGVGDAKIRKYDPPPPSAPPDFDTMNYQAGWLSMGVPLPPGVVHIGPGGVPVAASGETGGLGIDKNLLIAGGVAAAAVLFLVLRR